MKSYNLTPTILLSSVILLIILKEVISLYCIAYDSKRNIFISIMIWWSIHVMLNCFWNLLQKAYSISVAAGTTEKEHELICRRTRDDKPGGRKNTTCVFPFKFDGITYDGICTNEMVSIITVYLWDYISVVLQPKTHITKCSY